MINVFVFSHDFFPLIRIFANLEIQTHFKLLDQISLHVYLETLDSLNYLLLELSAVKYDHSKIVLLLNVELCPPIGIFEFEVLNLILLLSDFLLEDLFSELFIFFRICEPLLDWLGCIGS